MFRLRNVGPILVVMGLLLGLMATPLLASDPERLVIAVSQWTRTRWETEIVPGFETEYNVKVEVRSYPWDALPLRLLTDALAGIFTHDVASILYGDIRSFVEEEFLEDLTQYEERFRESKLVPVKYHGTAFGVSLPWIDWVESLVVFRASRHKELALKLLEFAAVSEKPEQEEIKVSLESTTMILALGFQDPDNRDLLSRMTRMTRESENIERILNLREFIDAMDYTSLEETVPRARQELSNKISLIEKQTGRSLNIYFPVDEHRRRWLDQRSEMWVAYDPFWLDEKEIEGIIAYDWDGNAHWLDSQALPTIPTLVVARSEHIPLQTEIEPGNEDMVYLVKLRISSEDMFHTIEWWFRGDAELYVWVVSSNGKSMKKQYWFPKYKREWARQGKWLDSRMVIDWDPEKHTETLHFSWWEFDGSAFKVVVGLEPYATGIIDIPRGDDEAGVETVRYDSIPTSRPGRIYRTGIVEWKLYKTE